MLLCPRFGIILSTRWIHLRTSFAYITNLYHSSSSLPPPSSLNSPSSARFIDFRFVLHFSRFHFFVSLCD
uniref:Putative secreted protein n=1 Tax=Anopheles darlingi TaxID=43151 RepID=A0A2M4DLY7_ANODA